MTSLAAALQESVDRLERENAALREERDLWMYRGGAAILMLPPETLCGDVKRAADELRARLEPCNSVITSEDWPAPWCPRCQNEYVQDGVGAARWSHPFSESGCRYSGTAVVIARTPPTNFTAPCPECGGKGYKQMCVAQGVAEWPCERCTPPARGNGHAYQPGKDDFCVRCGGTRLSHQ